MIADKPVPIPFEPHAVPAAGSHVVIGWDVGGAHLKACVVINGAVADVAQWPCPLWQGIDQLRHAIDAARTRWPEAMRAAGTRHVATMTGEMVDLFADRATGVRALASELAEALGPHLMLYAGIDGGGAGPWIAPRLAQQAWRELASANWRATATWVARVLPEALLVDIGSTTTDLIAVRGGALCDAGEDDAARLADGSLVYQGVVRTPLCALAPRVPFGGQTVNVMNEFFATTADVYRLTQELDPAHDQHPAADHKGKDAHATCQRLARMIGRDASDADAAAWLSLAHAWRRAQSHEIAGQMQRVVEHHRLAADTPVVSAGCGDFLAEALARALRHPVVRFADLLPSAVPSPEVARWAQVAAPAVAVALLAAQAQAGAGTGTGASASASAGALLNVDRPELVVGTRRAALHPVRPEPVEASRRIVEAVRPEPVEGPGTSATPHAVSVAPDAVSMSAAAAAPATPRQT